MKRYIILFFAFMILVGFGSCKKFLDTKPKDFQEQGDYYETEEQLNSALTGVYNILKQQAAYGNFMLGRIGLDADEGYDSSASRVTGPSVYQVSDSEVTVANYWANFYSGINRANILLANIDKPIMDATTRQRIHGEALFLKAYFYFMLVSRFGDIPYLDKAVASASEAIAIDMPQISAAQVYERIVKDMIEAEGMVPTATATGFGGRVNKSAVQGILARVYLYWAGYPVKDESKYKEARFWAEKVVSSNEHDLNPDYTRVFINYAQDKYDIKESIWEVEFWGDNTGYYQGGGRVGSTLGIPSDDPETGYVNAYMRINGRLYYSYNSADQRRDWNIAPFTYTGIPSKKVPLADNKIYDRFIGKYRREYELVAVKGTAATPENYPLLRYSDVLLMFAEADNFVNNGPTPAAYEAINQVRRRAFKKPIHLASGDVDLVGYNKQTFLTELQDERSRELCFECLRKSDLVRWEIFLPRMKTIMQDYLDDKPTSRTYGILGFQNAAERDVLWPIPSYEIALNKLLHQNKGW